MSNRVTLVVMGQSPIPVNVSPGSTIEEVCRVADQDTDGRSFSLNGTKVALGTEVSDGDVVRVAQKVTGGR